jgi:predicted DNA binding CopG/RHH family protein
MKSITAKEFDKKFDNNEDITEYLDFSKAMKLKEFKKIKETKKINLDIPQNILNFIDQEANKIGVTRQALLKVWIFERLKKELSHPLL